MKLTYPAEIVFNPFKALRSAGYNHFTDPVTKKESYVLRTSADYYPRFHVYVKEEAGKVVVDLHLDQKKAQYKGAHAHNAEYDGPTVEKEMRRIAGWFKQDFKIDPEEYLEAPPAATTPEVEEGSEEPTEETKPSDGFGGIFS